jgi:hypothetical protein
MPTVIKQKDELISRSTYTLGNGEIVKIDTPYVPDSKFFPGYRLDRDLAVLKAFGVTEDDLKTFILRQRAIKNAGD